MPRLSVVERFWALVDMNGSVPANLPDLGNCWLWQGNISGDGYGRFWDGTRKIQAHNFLISAGIGLQPDHLCRNRRCVRPSHLEPITCRENLLRGDTLASHNALKTHCKNGHPFDDSNTKIRPTGRDCYACGRERTRRYEERKRQIGARV
jgi:hypothetical protein